MSLAQQAPLPPSTKKKVHFDALVFSRYVASCWIVAHHFYGQATFEAPSAATAGVRLGHRAQSRALKVFHFGTLWTQYFFFLSGFVLTLARFTSRDPDELKPTWRFVAERLTTTYPAYALSLVLMLFNRGDALITVQLADWVNFGLHVTLLQAWWPQMVCADRFYVKLDPLLVLPRAPKVRTSMIHWNTPAWFMSALLFYWLLFKPLYRLVRRLPSRSLGLVFFACWLCSSFAFFDNTLLRGGGGINAARDALYRYHPFAYVHVFFGGMVFARLFVEDHVSSEDAEEEDDASSLFRHQVAFLRRRFVARGASVAYFVIFTTALTTSVEALSGSSSRKGGENALFFFWHNGGLLPLFALLVAGLCSERDTLSHLFAHPVLVAVGSVSYAQYIIQGVVFHLVYQAYRAAFFRHSYYRQEPYGPWTFQLVLPLVLFASAFLVHHCLSVPCASHLRKKLDDLSSSSSRSSKLGLAATNARTYGTLFSSNGGAPTSSSSKKTSRGSLAAQLETAPLVSSTPPRRWHPPPPRSSSSSSSSRRDDDDPPASFTSV